MSRWSITPTPEGMRLHRPGRQRLDFAASATISHARPKRLAHQIRQDLWRALQNLKGFSPVVEISGDTVRAGGQVDGPIPPTAQSTAQALLDSPKHRRRWLRHAVLALCALPMAEARAETLTCAPDLPFYCANLHVSCAGRSRLATRVLDIELSETRATIGSTAFNVTHDRDTRILRSDAPGYIRIGPDGRFAERIYVKARALMSIGTCVAQEVS